MPGSGAHAAEDKSGLPPAQQPGFRSHVEGDAALDQSVLIAANPAKTARDTGIDRQALGFIGLSQVSWGGSN
jgi:hypothetical protein